MAIIMGQRPELETAGRGRVPTLHGCTRQVSRYTLQVFIQRISPAFPRCHHPPAAADSWALGHSPVSRAPRSLGATTLTLGITFTGAIVAVCVICWMPYHAHRLMYCYISDDGWTQSGHIVGRRQALDPGSRIQECGWCFGFSPAVIL
ncbi:Neurotensin receptor type 2 [Manis javanica]|nr:Neurotensin receptor type 2 [Manis javanica]